MCRIITIASLGQLLIRVQQGGMLSQIASVDLNVQGHCWYSHAYGKLPQTEAKRLLRTKH